MSSAGWVRRSPVRAEDKRQVMVVVQSLGRCPPAIRDTTDGTTSHAGDHGDRRNHGGTSCSGTTGGGSPGLSGGGGELVHGQRFDFRAVRHGLRSRDREK